MNYHTIRDRSLIELCQHGDRNGYQQLYFRFRQPVISYVLQMVHNHEVTIDIVHRTFSTFFKQLHHISLTDACERLIFRIARNICIESIQARPQNVPHVKQPHQSSFQLRTVPEPFREILIFKFEYHYSDETIASITGQSVQTVQSYLEQALTLVMNDRSEETPGEEDA